MRGGIMYEQREIVLVPFPYTDLSISKLRPALIISNKKINNSEDRICCLVTSNTVKEGIFIEKNCFENGKLPFKSWIKSHRIFTVNSRIIKKSLCKINKKFYDKVLAGINEYLK